METMHHYNIALLDGDLLIIAPTLSDLHPMQAHTLPAPPPQPLTVVSMIANRIHSRESELPHLLPLWSE